MKSKDTPSATHWEQAYQQLLAALRVVNTTDSSPLQYCQPCIGICLRHLTALRTQLRKYPLLSEEQEIHFFKSVKPRFHGQLIYYSKIWEIELRKPAGNRPQLDKYYQKHLKRIQHFSDYHRDIYLYYRMGATYLDKEYFARNPTTGIFLPSYKHIDADPDFSTAKDYLFSRIIANDMLSAYLQHAMTPIAGAAKVQPPGNKRQLTWKGPKVGLIEFGYACKEANILEESLHEIFEVFEVMFSIELKNTSRTFQEILSRKKEEAVFMDKLVVKLKERMDKMHQQYKPSK
ncbi:RteC domain-containing protein [Chitinophaga cymbidii]|uniref:RteC protein n=1 Tax=Chitinophaga cymbidii TaxID=1096750 RepID=A0A512RFN1_9BACT|nr:RteC domain-containing protein [Chitinophaga cymbidii]GEP94505.1 hypothetical protein CCY01nite_07650 [Chitinophaga cymbidii]